MLRLFHLSALVFSLLIVLNYSNISYAQIINPEEIKKTELNKTNEEKYKKIEENNILINQQKDKSVRNAMIALILIIIIISIIFYYTGRKQKCPSCNKIFAGTVVECVPIEKNAKNKYSIKKKCIFCGHEWEITANKMKKVKIYEEELLI